MRRSTVLAFLLLGLVVSTTKVLPLLTTVGNPDVSALWSIWEPWPQEDLWDVLNPGYKAESQRLHRFYRGYPEAIGGDTRATIKYSSADLQRFSLADSEVFWRMKPARPDGGVGTNLYQMFALEDPDSGDGLSFVRAEIEGVGGDINCDCWTMTEDLSAITLTPGGYESGNAVVWDPSGTYVAVGGGGSPDWVKIFKWDGAHLTHISSLPDMPYDPYEIYSLAWDDTGTYLVAGHYIDEGTNMSLYKRDGETFTRLPNPPNMSEGWQDYVVSLDWVGNYLAVGCENEASPSHGLGIYGWNPTTETFTILITTDANNVHSVRWTSDHAYLAAASWYTAWSWDEKVQVFSWDGTSLSELTGSPFVPYYSQAVAWDATDTYLAVGQYFSGGTALLLYKRVGTTISLASTPVLISDEVTQLRWHPTLPLLIVGHEDGSTHDPAFSWWCRDGDTLTALTPALAIPDDTYAYGAPDGLGWRPQGDVVVGGYQTGSAGDWLILYHFTGGEPELIQLADPSYPYSTVPDSADNLTEAKWDPSGTYLAVCGYNGDFDEFFAWYKRSGTTLTKLTTPTGNEGADGCSWDATGTYLAVGANSWWGLASGIYLYKRSGDTLTEVDFVTVDPSSVGPGRSVWMGDYLLIGHAYSYYGSWNSGQDGMALYLRSGDALSFVASYGGPYPRGAYSWDVYSFDVHPSGDWVLVHYLDMDSYDYKMRVYSWDGAGGLALVEDVAADDCTEHFGEYRVRARWSPSGNHAAVGMFGDPWGRGVVLFSWDSGTETLTEQPAAATTGQSRYHGQHPIWSLDGKYIFVVGDQYSGTGPQIQIRVLELVGNSLDWFMDGPAHNDLAYYTYGSDLSPNGCMIAATHSGGNLLTLWQITGFTSDAGLVIRLSAGAWTVTDEWEADYDEDDHAWIRFRHDAATGTIYADTAGVCGVWVERLAFVGSPAPDVGKLALEAEAWVTTAETDTDAPTVGWYGPLNPRPQEILLPLLTSLLPLPLELGTNRKTLPLLTRLLP